MPARVTARSSRSSAPATKSCVAAQDSTPSEHVEAVSSLRQQVCSIFADAQRTTTGHRKLIAGLRKIQEACCFEPAVASKHAREQEDFDEEDFNQEVERCVMRILVVKKSESVGDRILRFLGAFLRHATDLDNAIFQEGDADVEQAFPETPTSRLTSRVLSFVLPLLSAKDKVVRYRSTQTVAHLINTLDSVDDELFDHIRLGLLKRLRDKESNVRVQAVYGLGRLAGESEVDQQDEDSDDDTAGGVLEKLLDVLQNDPSSDVRRSLLLNLPFTPTTLPFLLERARDVDPSIRRALYSRLLPALGDFRHLSLTHREKLLRWGLRDRDENVRKATARLFRERWIEDCARSPDAEVIDPKHVSPPTSEGLLELLERIDVVNAGVDGGIALDAMKDFWRGRPDYRDFVTFDETYWKQLTPESAFVARTFNDFCRSHEDSAMQRLAEDKMPEVTRFAFLIQQGINDLVDAVRRIAIQEDAEEDSVQQEFVVEQLLHIALTLDFSDEIGRRKMFSLMSEALGLAELPEESTRLVVEVLRTVCDSNASGERDFCRVVLEAVAEVHDTIVGEEQDNKGDEDESFHSAKSELSDDAMSKEKTPEEVEQAHEKAIREIMVNMKCLHIAQCLLQNVEGSLEQNVHLVTMLNNLVVPAVRSQEAPIRERGLLCLGLCCLLDKSLAEENLTLFLHCFNKGHEALQNIAIQIIGDILAAHPSILIPAPNTEVEVLSSLQKPLQKLFSKALKSGTPSIQSTACTALCKLMLSSPSGITTSILNSDDLLRLLVISYFDPQTSGNHGLRQALSYFLPVYCHSRRENMERMGRLVLSILHWCIDAKEEVQVDGEDEPEMVGLAVIVSHLVDWTDGRRLVAVNLPTSFDEAVAEADSDVHLDILTEVLGKVLGSCPKDERKIYMSVLSKIYISGTSDLGKLERALDLVDDAIDNKIAADATSRNALVKVQTSLTKAIGNSSQSRSQSRGLSSVPSIIGEDNEHNSEPSAEPASEIDDDRPSIVEVTESIETPFASPSKRTRHREKHSIRPGRPKSALHDPEESLLDDDADTIMGDASPTPTPARNGDATEDTATILEAPTPTPTSNAPDSPSKRTRSRKTSAAAKFATAPAAKSIYEEDLSSLLESSTVEDASELPSELHSEVSTDVATAESTIIEEPRAPIARVPARATKGPLAALAQAPTARRSVRASRRKTESMD